MIRKKHWRSALAVIMSVTMLLGNTWLPGDMSRVLAAETGEPEQTCGHHIHDEECGYEDETGTCNYECPVCEVQALIDALPGAEEITTDNVKEVAGRLNVVEAAVNALEEDSAALLDMERYQAALDAVQAFNDSSDKNIKDVDAGKKDTGNENLICEHHIHDEECGYEETGICNYECPVCRVQKMIDELPEADAVTEENVEEVIGRLEAIDAAELELTDEQMDLLDTERYMAAANVAAVIKGDSGNKGDLQVIDDPAARIGEGDGARNFETLQAAVDAVGDSETTIWLLKNTVEDLVIPAGETIVLDLNGCTLTGASGHTICNEGTLTIMGDAGSQVVTNKAQKQALYNKGTIKFGTSCQVSVSRTEGTNGYVIYNAPNSAMEIQAAVKVQSPSANSSCIDNYGTLTLGSAAEAPTIDGAYIAVKNDETGILTVTNAVITGYDQAIQNWNTATISGGTINGAVATWAYSDNNGDYAGSTKIEGGTINGSGNGSILACWYTGNYEAKKIPEVIITAGTINGEMKKGSTADGSNLTREENGSEKGVITVSGGTFDTAVDPAFCADGFVPVNVQGSDGKYTVEKLSGANAAASIDSDGNTEYYSSLEAAVVAVKPGEKITLLKGIKLADDTPLKVENKGSKENPVIFNLNGHTISGSSTEAYTGTETGIVQLLGSYVKITDEGQEKGGIVNENDGSGNCTAVFVSPTSEQAGYVTIEGGLHIENKSTGSYSKAVYLKNNINSTESAQLIIENAVVISAKGDAADIFVGSGCSGQIIINGGEFSTGTANRDNILATKNMTVNGGKFHNWAPFSTNLVAEGKTIMLSETTVGEYTVEVGDIPTDYVAHIADMNLYLVSGDLYTLYTLQSFSGKTVEVKKSASFTFPDGKYFGIASGSPSGMTLDLAEEAVLSGRVPMALADVTVSGNGTVSEGTFSETDADMYELTLDTAAGMYSCRLKADKIAVKVTNLSNGTVQYYSDVQTGLKQLQTISTTMIIDMYQDCSIGTRINVKGDKTLRLNGHIYTYTGTTSASFSVDNNASLIIENGKVVVGASSTAAIMPAKGSSTTGAKIIIAKDTVVEGNGIFLQGKANTLEVYGTIDTTGTSNTAVMGNGSAGQGPTTINIYDGAVIKSDNIAIYHPQAGTLNVQGGEITGSDAIYMKSGNLNITGGTITGNGQKADYAYWGNGANSTGDAIVLDACGYPAGAPVVNTFKGATVLSEHNAAVACYHKDGQEDMADKKFITGGLFSNDVTEYCADNLQAVKTSNSGENYLIQAVCFAEMTINGGKVVRYSDQQTFLKALMAATGNIDIKLLGDVEINGYVPVQSGQNVTFDLNGSVLSTSLQRAGYHYYAINNCGTLTIKDTSTDGAGTIRARGVQNNEGGTLTVESGTIVSVDANGGACIWNEAEVTINGGTFKTEQVGSPSDQYGVGCLNNSGKATITGGAFYDVNRRTYAIISTGEIEITPADGKTVTVHGAHGGLAVDSGTAVVNGGDYSSDDYYALYVSNDGTGQDPSTAMVTVNGGTFDGKNYSVWIGSDINNPVNSSIAITDGVFYKPLNAQENSREGAIAISGGEFSVTVPEEYCADGFIPVTKANEAGRYTVEKLTAENATASIGSGETVKYYSSLEAALADAADGDTVTLLKNITVSEDALISIDEGVTLTVKDGVTLTNEGIIDVYGDLDESKVTNKNNGRVVYHIKGISLNKSETDLTVKGEETLTVTRNPGNAMEEITVEWSSSDETVASVSQDGKVTAVGKGKAVLMAKVTVTIQGKERVFTATCAVDVYGANQDAPSAPSMKDHTSTSITLQTVANSPVSGAKAQYSKDGGQTWQDSPEFKNLLPGTEYSFAVRYAATGDMNFAPSGPSSIVKFSTWPEKNFAPEKDTDSDDDSDDGGSGNNNSSGGNAGASAATVAAAPTGDNAEPLLWAALALAAILAIAGAAISRRRGKRR